MLAIHCGHASCCNTAKWMTFLECNHVHAGCSVCHLGPETLSLPAEDLSKADAFDFSCTTVKIAKATQDSRIQLPVHERLPEICAPEQRALLIAHKDVCCNPSASWLRLCAPSFLRLLILVVPMTLLYSMDYIMGLCVQGLMVIMRCVAKLQTPAFAVSGLVPCRLYLPCGTRQRYCNIQCAPRKIGR